MKIHQIPIILITLIFVSLPGRSQDYGYNLSDYKNPDYVYKSLNLRLNLSNPFSVFNSDDNGYGKGHAISLNTNASGGYYRFSNSLKFQGEQSIFSGIESFVSNAKSDRSTFQTKDKSLRGNYYLQAKAINRFYFKADKYLEFDPALDFSIGANRAENSRKDQLFPSTYTLYKSNNSSLTISLPVYYGIGRIEQVQDAQIALNMLDDLKKLNLLNGNIQINQIETLAQLITKLKFKRAFDYRIQKIAEMKALDSLFALTGIVNTRNVEFFSILRDNWDYANSPIRMSGKRYFAGFNPKYLYQNQKSNQNNGETENLINSIIEQKNWLKQYSIGFTSGIEIEKPLSRKIQRSVYATADAGVLSSTTFFSNPTSTADKTQISKVLPMISLESGITYGFYPNTRSWYTANWSLFTGYNQTKRNDPTKLENNALYIYSGPAFNAYYYIAPNLRLTLQYTGEFRYNYNLEKIGNTTYQEKWWNQQLNASIVYNLY